MMVVLPYEQSFRGGIMSDNLEKLFLVLKTEIQLSQAELNELLVQDCDKVEKCELRSKKTGCDLCSLKEECREESKKIFAKMDILEEELMKMLSKAKSLLEQISKKQRKE